MDIKQRRELYKAMRSAHDGICPLCGGNIAHGDTNKQNSVRFYCESICDFYLTIIEVATISSWHADFHRDLSKVLADWRQE